MLCPVIIGRDAQIVALTSALDDAAMGQGGVVLITGEAGVGKTRLARDLSALAASRGLLTLTGRATQSPVPAPYRPVAEALIGVARDGLALDSPGMADYRAVLGTLVPEWSDPADGSAEVSPVILGEAVLRLLAMTPGVGERTRRSGRAGHPGRPGALLVLEDLHWADPETLAIVEYLADNVSSTPVLCVITQRVGERAGRPDILESALARRAVTAIDVPRLTQAGVAQMAAACLDVEHLPAEVHRLLADCGGLPFAVEEILAAAVTSGELVHGPLGWQVNSAISTGLPESIVGSVRGRLASLGQDLATVIVAAAVVGKQFDWDLLPAVAKCSAQQVLDALQRARDLQLIEPAGPDPGTFRFRHSLTREAIVADLLPPELACRAAAAATAIEAAHPGLPGPWCELAAEMHAAAGQPLAAARLLLTSAHRAIRQGAVSTGIAALEDASQLVTESSASEPDLGELDLQIDEALASALALAGDRERLGTLAEELVGRLEAAGADPRRQARILLAVAGTRPEDHLAAAAAHIEAAETIADRLGDAELTSRVGAVSARHALVTGELDRAGRLARRSLATAEAAQAAAEASGGQASPGWAMDVALAALDVIGHAERTRDFDAARTAFQRARDLAVGADRGAWRINALHQLATLDMLEAGDTAGLAQVRALAHQAGVLSTATTIELQLANVWSLGEDLDLALTAARRCERAAGQLGAHRLRGMACCLQANVFAIRSDREQAARAVQRAEAVSPGDMEILFTSWGQSRVLEALFRDDIVRAVKASRTGMSFARQAYQTTARARSFYSPVQSPVLAPRRSWGLYALLQSVDGADGGAAVGEAQAAGATASWNGGCLAYASAVVAGRAGQVARATALAGQGDTAFAQFAPWWRHLARRLVAADALSAGWGEPVAWMREAMAAFEATGHARLASACRGILRKAGERVPRAGRGAARVPPRLRSLGVTSREMDVFLLVALGLSNTDIARKLYISPKTVETHVASLIVKTGQRGRRELVAHAASVTGEHQPPDQ
jgi:DNA-binding CsgD family transcriptional regulator